MLENDWGERVVKQMHTIVAQVFVPNPRNYSKVRHKNGLINDNSAENLEWYD